MLNICSWILYFQKFSVKSLKFHYKITIKWSFSRDMQCCIGDVVAGRVWTCRTFDMVKITNAVQLISGAWYNDTAVAECIWDHCGHYPHRGSRCMGRVIVVSLICCVCLYVYLCDVCCLKRKVHGRHTMHGGRINLMSKGQRLRSHSYQLHCDCGYAFNKAAEVLVTSWNNKTCHDPFLYEDRQVFKGLFFRITWVSQYQNS